MTRRRITFPPSGPGMTGVTVKLDDVFDVTAHPTLPGWSILWVRGLPENQSIVPLPVEDARALILAAEQDPADMSVDDRPRDPAFAASGPIEWKDPAPRTARGAQESLARIRADLNLPTIDEDPEGDVSSPASATAVVLSCALVLVIWVTFLLGVWVGRST